MTTFQLRKRSTDDITDDIIHKTPRQNPRDNSQKCDDPQKCQRVDPHIDESESASSEGEQTSTVKHSGKDNSSDEKPQPLTAEELAEVRAKIKARQKAGLVCVGVCVSKYIYYDIIVYDLSFISIIKLYQMSLRKVFYYSICNHC